MSRPSARVERITDSVAYHGEGPVWSDAWGGLRWVDMFAGDVLSLGSNGEVTRRHVASLVACVRPRRGGGAVLGVERGFALEAPDGTMAPLPELWPEADKVRMNEGACDPEGRFYCGSMAYDRRPGGGSVNRLDPDGSVNLVRAGVAISNGLDWSPDGSLAYYNDTGTHQTDVFDYDPDAGLTGRRRFAETPGRPDGLTVDAEGGVWIALSDGAQVRRYSAEGHLDAVIELPATKVTACTFGGPELDQLFITTSREDLPDGEEPMAGSLFMAMPGVRGLPTRAFAG